MKLKSQQIPASFAHSNRFARLQWPSLLVLGSLVPIVGGVALASLTEVSFNWLVPSHPPRIILLFYPFT
jgi:hypothetical protein